eukprot:4441888-Pyramimonas_sp.AAC.1
MAPSCGPRSSRGACWPSMPFKRVSGHGSHRVHSSAVTAQVPEFLDLTFDQCVDHRVVLAQRVAPHPDMQPAVIENASRSFISRFWSSPAGRLGAPGEVQSQDVGASVGGRP